MHFQTPYDILTIKPLPSLIQLTTSFICQGIVATNGAIYIIIFTMMISKMR
jgi:hypothetical protein